MSKLKKLIYFHLIIIPLYMAFSFYAGKLVYSVIQKKAGEYNYHFSAGKISVGIIKGVRIYDMSLSGEGTVLSAHQVKYHPLRGVEIMQIKFVTSGVSAEAPSMILKGNLLNRDKRPILPEVSVESPVVRINSSKLSTGKSGNLGSGPVWISRCILFENCLINYDNVNIICDMNLKQQSADSEMDFSASFDSEYGNIVIRTRIDTENFSAEVDNCDIIFRDNEYSLSGAIGLSEGVITARNINILSGKESLISFSASYDTRVDEIYISMPDQVLKSSLIKNFLPQNLDPDGDILLREISLCIRNFEFVEFLSGSAETDKLRFMSKEDIFEVIEGAVFFEKTSKNNNNPVFKAGTLSFNENKISKIVLPIEQSMDFNQFRFQGFSFEYEDADFHGSCQLNISEHKADFNSDFNPSFLEPQLPGIKDFTSVEVSGHVDFSDKMNADINIIAEGEETVELSFTVEKALHSYVFRRIFCVAHEEKMITGKGVFNTEKNSSEFILQLVNLKFSLFERILTGEASFPAVLNGDMKISSFPAKTILEINNFSCDASELALSFTDAVLKGIINNKGMDFEIKKASFFGGILEGELKLQADSGYRPEFRFLCDAIDLSGLSSEYLLKNDFQAALMQGTGSFILNGKLNDERILEANGSVQLSGTSLYAANDPFSTIMIENSSFLFSVLGNRIEISSRNMLEKEIELSSEGFIILKDNYEIEEVDFGIRIKKAEGNSFRDCFFYFIPEMLQEAEFSGSLGIEGRLAVNLTGSSFFEGTVEFSDMDIKEPTTLSLSGISGTAPLFFNLGKTDEFLPSTPGWKREEHAQILTKFTEKNKSVQTDYNLKIGNISYGAFYCSAFEVPLMLKNGKIYSPMFTGKFYNGDLIGHLELALGKDTTDIYLFSFLRNTSLNSLCESHKDISGMVSGTLEGVIAFQSKIAETSSSQGILHVWALKKGAEKREINSDLLVKMGAEQALVFSRIKHITYDEGELSCALQNGNIIFNDLKLYHTADPIGSLLRSDLSFEFRLPAGKNRIAVERLLNYLERTGAL